MLDHPAIDVGLGLIFFYVVLSLVTSAIQEWIASIFGLRSKNLLSGVRNLIGKSCAKEIYDHPLIKNLSQERKLPSYLASETLATVLLEVVEKESARDSNAALTAEEAQAFVSRLPDEHGLKEIISTLIKEGDGTINGLKVSLAAWFDEGMSRVSGWYKRRVKLIILLIASSVVLLINGSSIHLAEELWRNDALRTQIAAQVQTTAQSFELSEIEAYDIENLKVFPIGWSTSPSSCRDWLKTILGWFITVAAISLGAPFWFDLLCKVANLRGSGDQTQKRGSS